jgi:endogenous inhibitor of DNA gyrase (YacG/DUF329 family)
MNPFAITNYQLIVPVKCQSCGKSTELLKGYPKGPHIQGNCPHCGKYVKHIKKSECVRQRAQHEDRKGSVRTTYIVLSHENGSGLVMPVRSTYVKSEAQSVASALASKYRAQGKPHRVSIDEIPGIHDIVSGKCVKSWQVTA